MAKKPRLLAPMVYTGPERRAHQVLVPTERRKPGRPRLVAGEDTIEVNVRLPESLYDPTCLIALRRGEDISTIIRLAIRQFVSANTAKD